jgi:ubiquinone/menaquinone biosynthesis C-methylase UbiE
MMEFCSKLFPFHLPGLFFVLIVAWVSLLGECRRLLLSLGMMVCARTKKEKSQQNAKVYISTTAAKLTKPLRTMIVNDVGNTKK